MERVPPAGYGGTERIVDELGRELTRRGHTVTLFASGDSVAPGRHVVTLPRSLRAIDFRGDAGPYFATTQLLALHHEAEFDLLHAHLDFHGLVLARAARRPVVSTFHGRLDTPFAADALIDPPRGLVAVSRSQADQQPDVSWEGVVHNGLSLSSMPFKEKRDDTLAFVGRIVPEKGIIDAIEIARLAGRALRVIAKAPWLPAEREYYQEVFLPARGRADIEEMGELQPAQRDAVLASSYATLMPGQWPEPFGLAAIESLACGSPVICRPVGGLREIVRHEVDGFACHGVAEMAQAVARIPELDRNEIRRSALARFSVERMADGYERVYARMLVGTAV